MTGPLAAAGAALYAAGWEWRRRAYARGWFSPRAVPARVVSVGNLTVGGTGKTTLTLHLVQVARGRGIRAAVVSRDYHPGRGGSGDETLLYRRAFGADAVFAGRRKRELAGAAAARGFELLVVDDGFSTWNLARELDIVLLDSQDLWGGGLLLPAGRLREPRRALQRADAIVVTRLGPGEDPGSHLAEARRYAPAALLAAGRHRVRGARAADGSRLAPGSRAWIVTGTGSPLAVERSAREAGFVVEGRSAYRDHHWFRAREIKRDAKRAQAAGAVLLTTAKDAVRWPTAPGTAAPAVLEVEWEWVRGGEAIERLVMEGRRGT
jgi:tetraacyldisaccharide 4'-kinase